LRGQDLNL